jgi:hypothetical protein
MNKIFLPVAVPMLLGLALSACTSDSIYVPGPTALCQPGICVGSTPGSTPESIAEMMP